MFCTNCGAFNKDDARFCVNCAESLGEIQMEERLSRPRLFNDRPILKRVDFLRFVFDFSFRQFVSLRIMKFLYGLSLLSAALLAVLFVFIGFKASVWLGFFGLLIGAPLIFLLTVLYSRVLLEMISVIFRMADHMANIGVPHIEEKAESRDGIRWNV